MSCQNMAHVSATRTQNVQGTFCGAFPTLFADSLFQIISEILTVKARLCRFAAAQQQFCEEVLISCLGSNSTSIGRNRLKESFQLLCGKLEQVARGLTRGWDISNKV